jgi:16S rRNA processing protein RimM
MTEIDGQPRVDVVVIGQLGAVHGVRGEVRLFPSSDVPGRFDQLTQVWWIGENGAQRPLHVKHLRAAGRCYLITFEGYEDRETALRLARGRIAIPASQRGILPPGRYFYDDLLGLDCYTESGECLGRIDAIYPTGANDVLEIKGQTREWLVPLQKRYVLDVDLAGRRLKIRLPVEG